MIKNARLRISLYPRADILRCYHRCILLTTHEMYEAESIGDRICIMCRGQAICTGTSQRLKERYFCV